MDRQTFEPVTWSAYHMDAKLIRDRGFSHETNNWHLSAADSTTITEDSTFLL
jgi:hypothetical protein